LTSQSSDYCNKSVVLCCREKETLNVAATAHSAPIGATSLDTFQIIVVTVGVAGCCTVNLVGQAARFPTVVKSLGRTIRFVLNFDSL
jgi:hypothetical protein